MRPAFALALLLTLLVAAAVWAAPPTPPVLAVGDAPAGRFEFAKVPEVALVRGLAQVVQLGIYQVDPTNPWPAGDLTRAGGWQSQRPTRLVDVATGQAATMFGYDAQTGELSYAGTWSGDVTVRIQEVVGAAQSPPFRVRVLTPTSVYGDNAASINAAKGWNARVCPSTQSFTTCRQHFTGGATDAAPTVVYIAPGMYSGQDWYLSSRRFVYVLGDPGNRPTLVGDALAGARKEMFYLANLDLRRTVIANTGVLVGAPNTMVVRNVFQCCGVGDVNGIVNPNKYTGADQFAVYWHASESKGMGGVGNTRHSAYIEMRPLSVFDVNNVRIIGSRGSSAVKTTMAELNVRHSLFTVSETPGSIPDAPCLPTEPSTGCLMQVPIDVPGFSAVVVYANAFELWRGPTLGVPSGRSGILPGALYIRQRKETLGSDIPNYPDVSWSPPVSSQATKVTPCYAWPGTAATYVADAFWQAVRSKPLDDPANPCTFKHYIAFNHFRTLPGSLPVTTLRDDGTYAAKATSQFSVTTDILRMHPLLVERSTNFLYGNTYDGGVAKYRLDFNPPIRNIDPQAAPFWPRNLPDEFPRALDVTGALPAWFKL